MQEEQVIIMVVQKAQNDFPEYEVDPVMCCQCEDQCWYVRVRLYKRATRDALDCWYGVYWGSQHFNPPFSALPHFA